MYTVYRRTEGDTERGRKMDKAERAAKGGEVGMNGYNYAGGQFLPNTTLPPMGRSGRRAIARQQSQEEYAAKLDRAWAVYQNDERLARAWATCGITGDDAYVTRRVGARIVAEWDGTWWGM